MKTARYTPFFLILMILFVVACGRQPTAVANDTAGETAAVPAGEIDDTPGETAAGAAEADDDAEPAYSVDLDPTDFVAVVDNPYLPMIPGSKYVYEGETAEGLERVEIEILRQTRNMMGIRATIFHDVVYRDGELIEETFD